MKQHPKPLDHEHQKLTPSEVARLFRVSPEKVMTWIRNGELRAVNVATRLGGRPRYVIDRADIAAFELRRQVVPPPPRTTRRNRRWEQPFTRYV